MENKKYNIISIASSTGGPQVLRVILPKLQNILVPIVITQHLSAEFSEQMIIWYNSFLDRKAKYGEEGEKVENDTIYFAPPDIHLTINKNRRIELVDKPKFSFQKPSANYMFSSIAESYGKRAIAVVLSGMGNDGALGSLDVANADGYVIAQDEKSCVVFGMPKEAIKHGGVNEIMNYNDIPERLEKLCSLTV